MALVKGKIGELEDRDTGKPERNCEQLAAALESADAGGRRHAARAIGSCPGAAAVLVARLKSEQDLAVREAILHTLLRLRDPSVASGLAAYLRSEDAALRNEVIETMKRLGAEVAPVLRLLLSDPDPDVRIFAVNILDSERYPEVESRLIEVIEHDPHVNVCATAVDLLCEAGTEAARDPLVRLKARFPTEAYIQFAADLALKRIREI
jgi:HEAT repeat protein